MNAARQLRMLFEQDAIYFAPGVYDALGAKLVEQADFQMVYATGGGIARSMGLPDMELLSFTQITERLTQIVDAVRMPVIADADNGYGGAVTAMHAVKYFMRAGVAAIHIEDQVFPKRCGHYEGKQVVPAKVHAKKIEAIKDSVPELFIIARTDAIAVEGLDAAIDRGHKYIDAGADMLFLEAPTTIGQIKKIGDQLPYLKLLNMFDTGKTPIVSLDDLKKWNYKLVIDPSDLQRSAIKAMQDTLLVLKKDGHSQAIRDKLVTFQEREEIIETAKYMDMLNQFSE
ncbi:MAG: oxaloacetate decarboxylase [Gammaproteobacteria bacterium]|nr:oxaloacetate decarboxylase [Gammaproteobacteria bacterium]